jgi:hypothetical protein
MMRNGILFLTIPEMAYIQWTSPYIIEWVEYMVQQFPTTTTIILAHQAIEDTTRHDNDNSSYPYRGKQDTDWWAEFFRNNEQIKMWIHGHQHWLDWYQGSQSSGRTHPVYDFGHEMVFSHPYSGVDWGNRHEEDRIVIYTISSTGISTRAWENNGTGGLWVTGYDHEWQIPTTYDGDAEDWYSYPVFIQDGETQLTDMKVLSSDITLELIGTKPMQLFFDEQMSTTSGWAGEVILSFANDQGGVTANTPGMTVTGPKTITFPPKNYRSATWEDGKSAQPYNFFPMGVTPHSVPGTTYQFTLTAKTTSGTGTIRLEVSASDWGTGSQYSTLPGSLETVLSHEFGTSFETLSGTYTVPADGDAWFLQGSVDFEDATDYEVTLFSIKRVRETDTTDNFEMVISGTSYAVSGTLLEDEKAEFSVDPVNLAQSDGVISFSGSIGGNHYGMARLIYHGPILMGRNARFRVNSASGGLFDVTLTDKVSDWPESVFKLFPFSIADSDLSITASDGSEQQHVSSNGNVWVSSNTPDTEEIDLAITYGIVISDADGDGIADHLDNCPNYPNGPLHGTCTEVVGVNLVVSTGQFCILDADCDPGEFCETSQADNYPPGGNGIGDACDCEADFDCDEPGLDVDASNMEQFLWDFGRSVHHDPCSNADLCNGDFNCDGNVAADDLPKLLEDFGRSLHFNPCPACNESTWCSY